MDPDPQHCLETLISSALNSMVDIFRFLMYLCPCDRGSFYPQGKVCNSGELNTIDAIQD
jgi:hypothetical protein